MAWPCWPTHSQVNTGDVWRWEQCHCLSQTWGQVRIRPVLGWVQVNCLLEPASKSLVPSLWSPQHRTRFIAHNSFHAWYTCQRTAFGCTLSTCPLYIPLVGSPCASINWILSATTSPGNPRTSDIPAHSFWTWGLALLV